MKPIAHFEQRYLIGEDGTVFSLLANKAQKPSINPNGYLKVGLSTGFGHEQHLVHILVARHYIPNPYEHPLVNHKDGVKSHCHANNLEWTTYEGNAQHALQHGLRPGYLAFAEKEQMLHRVLAGAQVQDLAQETGRRVETLHKMLREAAKKLNIHDQWMEVMKGNRLVAALRNLEKING
jgi:hypothetical protein